MISFIFCFLVSLLVNVQAFSGSMTYYSGGGLGSCGTEIVDSSHLVALNQPQMQAGMVDGNSNHNSLCGKCIEITLHGKTVQATVADTCPECASGDVDVTMSVFSTLASLDVGRINVEWNWCDSSQVSQSTIKDEVQPTQYTQQANQEQPSTPSTQEQPQIVQESLVSETSQPTHDHWTKSHHSHHHSHHSKHYKDSIDWTTSDWWSSETTSHEITTTIQPTNNLIVTVSSDTTSITKSTTALTTTVLERDVPAPTHDLNHLFNGLDAMENNAATYSIMSILVSILVSLI